MHSSEWLKTTAPHTVPEIIALHENDSLSAHIPEGLITIAKDVVDRWQVNLEDFDGERSAILFQGAGKVAPQPDPMPVGFESIAATAS